MGIPFRHQIEVVRMHLERYSGGKLVENWLHYDALRMMQQLGVVPSPEQAGA